MNIEEKLIELFKRVFRINFIDKEVIKVGNVEEWDSLSHIKLIMEIEKEFMISIESDIIPDLYSNFFKISDYLKNKLEN